MIVVLVTTVRFLFFLHFCPLGLGAVLSAHLWLLTPTPLFLLQHFDSAIRNVNPPLPVCKKHFPWKRLSDDWRHIHKTLCKKWKFAYSISLKKQNGKHCFFFYVCYFELHTSLPLIPAIIYKWMSTCSHLI